MGSVQSLKEPATATVLASPVHVNRNLLIGLVPSNFCPTTTCGCAASSGRRSGGIALTADFSVGEPSLPR